MTRQYCVYTLDENFINVMKWVKENNIEFESHINRTRFWVPEGPKLTWFLVKWAAVCPVVKDNEDYLTGQVYE